MKIYYLCIIVIVHSLYLSDNTLHETRMLKHVRSTPQLNRGDYFQDVNISSSSSSSCSSLQDVGQVAPVRSAQVWGRMGSGSNNRSQSRNSAPVSVGKSPCSPCVSTDFNTTASSTSADTKSKQMSKEASEAPRLGYVEENTSRRKVQELRISKKKVYVFPFGLRRREVVLLTVLAAVCLLLYIVLLVMTVKAASCTYTVQEYFSDDPAE